MPALRRASGSPGFRIAIFTGPRFAGRCITAALQKPGSPAEKIQRSITHGRIGRCSTHGIHASIRRWPSLFAILRNLASSFHPLPQSLTDALSSAEFPPKMRAK
jgi:hypothetical protein